MKVRIQLVVEGESGESEKVEEIVRLERGALRSEELGLTLAEAKALLHGMQQAMVTEQIAEYLESFEICPDCGKRRARKGQHFFVYRTLFGKCRFVSPRFYDCPCRHRGRHSSSPLAALLDTHCAPELLYLQTKFASLMSYGLSIDLLTEILPITENISHTSMRRYQQHIAERMEGELGKEQFQFIEGCPRDWAKQPPPGPPLTVGLDGGYVHASDQRSKNEGWFEVLTGKSIQPEGHDKVFAFVNQYDTKPKRRLYEVLKSQGLQMNQQVVFLSDGGDTVRDLQHYLSPESEHLLDWFHITMRLTVMGQMIKGMATELKPNSKHPETATVISDLTRHLESLKWHLWHGDVLHALQRIDDLEDDLEILEENPANKKKLKKAVREFHTYIEANQAFIPNYGDRYRHHETISTAFVESTVNYVVSKRFVKKQQMRWSRRGAHLLLRTIADGLEWSYGWSEPAAQRLRFLLDFGYATGLRTSELVGAVLRNVRVDERGDHWLHLIGKGGKPGKVALPPLARSALNQYLVQRQLPVTPQRWNPATPIIASLGEDKDAGIAGPRLWRVMRRFFLKAADLFQDDHPTLAEKLRRASPHWMRHSHASHALARGAQLTSVRDNLRHASIATTSMYLHSDEVQRAKQMNQAFAAHKWQQPPSLTD